MSDLTSSLQQYNEQLSMVGEALKTAKDDERDSLLALQSELVELIQLTEESLDTVTAAETNTSGQVESQNEIPSEIDDEYALFMREMKQCGAHETDSDKKAGSSKDGSQQEDGESDIEDELSTLLGMKCAVYHTHKWGGQPTLHNAMVSAVEPRQDDDQFNDLQVRVLYTHPTHTEMLPCPYYLDGECKFDDDKCRYSHGALVKLSELKDAMEPNFDSIKVGSRILLKIKPPDDEDASLTKKSTEKYFLWHRAVVRSVDVEKRICIVKLEQGSSSGDKRKSAVEEHHVKFEDLFPLSNETEDTESDDSLSDTEYPESKAARPNEPAEAKNEHGRALLIEQSLHSNAPPMGEWERHTRGIGSKLMLAMGYVPGSGLGAEGDGIVKPVEARLLPVGKSLDHCMAISERAGAQDPLKVEQKLKRMQKKEEERNKRAYEREKEREKKNVFNFLNKTLGAKDEAESSKAPAIDIKQTTSKDLNIEHFKIMEDTKKIERDIVKLNNTLAKYQPGTPGHMNINMQLAERSKELNQLKNKERQITKEQNNRKDKQKMTVF